MLIFGDQRINYQMRRSLRELSIDMVINKCFFKNTQITFFPSFTFIPKADMRLHKTGISFYCESNAPESLTLMSSVISELKEYVPPKILVFTASWMRSEHLCGELVRRFDIRFVRYSFDENSVWPLRTNFSFSIQKIINIYLILINIK